MAFVVSAIEVRAAFSAESKDANARVVLSDRYNPLGIPLWSFIANPAFEIEHEYDDNIFRRDQGRRSDQVTVFKPSVDVQTDWSLHQIRAGASAAIGRYRDNGSEDYDDYSYYVSGRYDIDYGTFLQLSVQSVHRHEDRGSLEDVNGDTPVESKVDSYGVAFARELGVVKLYFNADIRDYSYDNSQRSGVLIDNSVRNYANDVYKTRLAYGLADNWDVYVEGQYDEWRYDVASSSYRDSTGQKYRLGTDISLSEVLFFSSFIGYDVRRYSPVFGDSDSFSFGSDIMWRINPLTSLKASLDRGLSESSLADSSGVILTNADVAVEHVWRPNILMDGRLRYQDASYEDSGVDLRRDNVTYASELGFEYRFNRVVRTDVEYDYTKRDYKGANQDYDSHKMSISFRFAL